MRFTYIGDEKSNAIEVFVSDTNVQSGKVLFL